LKLDDVAIDRAVTIDAESNDRWRSKQWIGHGPGTCLRAQWQSMGDGAGHSANGIKGQSGNHATFRRGVKFAGGAQRDTLIYDAVRSLARDRSRHLNRSIPKRRPESIFARRQTFAILAGAGVGIPVRPPLTGISELIRRCGDGAPTVTA